MSVGGSPLSARCSFWCRRKRLLALHTTVFLRRVHSRTSTFLVIFYAEFSICVTGLHCCLRHVWLYICRYPSLLAPNFGHTISGKVHHVGLHDNPERSSESSLSCSKYLTRTTLGGILVLVHMLCKCVRTYTYVCMYEYEHLVCIFDGWCT